MTRQYNAYLHATILAAARRQQANYKKRRPAEVIGTTEATVDGRKVKAEIIVPAKHKPTDRKV